MMKTLFTKKTYHEISPAEAKERLEANQNILLLDVRTPEEYAAVRIPGSRLLPLNQVESGISKIAGDKNTEIIVYCLSGGRAAAACTLLNAMGYANVSNMGGISSWKYKTASGPVNA